MAVDIEHRSNPVGSPSPGAANDASVPIDGGGRQRDPGESSNAGQATGDESPANGGLHDRLSLATRIHGTPVAWAVLAVSLVLTAVAWYFSQQYIDQRIGDRFEHRATQINEALRKRMLAYEQVLRGGVGLYAASNAVSRDEWREYVNSLQLESNYPGIQGMGVSIPVLPDELAAHIQSVREEGFVDYTIKPDTPRAIYHSIIYLEPFDWRNRRAFGFDMYSNPVRRKAMDRAIETGNPAISDVVTLVQETKTDVQKGFLFYIPMYRAGAPLASAQDRRAAFTGFVYAAFRAADLMHGVLGPGTSNVRFRVHDGSAITPDSSFYDSAGKSPEAPRLENEALRTERTLTVGGNTWTLELHATEGFASKGENLQSLAVAVGGLIVDVLLFLIINAIARERRKAVNDAMDTGRSLRRKESELKSIFDSAPDAIVSVGPDGNIVHWNHCASVLFRYTREAALGMPALRLLDDTSARNFENLLNEGMGDDELRLSIELTGRRSDSSRVPLEVSVARWQSEDGKVFVTLTLRDVSERKEMQQAQVKQMGLLQQTNEELDRFAHATSHDLKAPLRAVDNLASWIEQDASDALPEKSREHLSRMRARIRRMEWLLDDLLAFSKAGRSPGEESTIEVDSLVAEVTSLLSPAAGMTVRVGGATPEFRSYRTPLRQVLQNLIGNAIKHHHESQGEILVSCEDLGDTVRFTVSDNGPGIAPEFHQRVFGMFETLRSRDAMEGSGVGLALVKKIVESLHGTVTLDSAEGSGTRVSFTWPNLTSSVTRRTG